MKGNWTRDQRLVVLGVLVAVAIGVSAFFLPEGRRFLHLDKPPGAQAAASLPVDATPQTTQMQTAEQPKQEQQTPLSKKVPGTQKTKTRVKGNHNVAGNNISGDSNVTGNGNQTGPTAIAPNGIAITGGTVTNPTVNNFAAARRRLSDDQEKTLTTCLSTTPGTFSVIAVMNNSEAYRYARDFYDVFVKAGWKNEQNVPVGTFMINGGSWTGVHFKFAGEWDEVAKRPLMRTGSAELSALNCLGDVGLTGVEGAPFRDVPTGSFKVEVAEHP